MKRLSTRISIATIVVAALLILAVPVLAGGGGGGWAVTTLDSLPDQVIAGKPLTVGFVVRQHGHAVMDGLSPTVTATHMDSGETLEVTATAQGEVGHYEATLRFVRAGTWAWSINAFGLESPMPPLTVLASEGATGSNALLPDALSLLVGVVGLTGTVGASVVWSRRRTRRALALIPIAMIISIAGFALSANRTQNFVAQAAPPTASQAEIGEALFVAKGCTTCHQNSNVNLRHNPSLSIGPNLTNLSADPAFLRLWLKDPSAIRPDTIMPTFGLSDDEIEALIVFLTEIPAS